MRDESLVRQLEGDLTALSRMTPTLDLDVRSLASTIAGGVSDDMSTDEMSAFQAETAVSMMMTNEGYDSLAARLAVARLHRRTSSSFACTSTPRPSFPGSWSTWHTNTPS
jgi:hypothetical protein